MRKFLRRAWAEIRQGENLDLYVGVCLSLVVSVAGMLGVADGSWVSSLILAVLALVCFGLLTQRHQNHQILEKVAEVRTSPTAASFFVRHDLAVIQRLVENSETVWLRGISLQSNIPIFDEALGRGLGLGRDYRILLTNPDGAALDIAAARWPSFSRADFVRDLGKNLRRLAYLKKNSTSGELDVRLIDDIGPYVIYIFNATRSDGSLMVRLPSLGSNDNRPTFWIYKQRDPQWFEQFIAEFEGEWNRAAPATTS